MNIISIDLGTYSVKIFESIAERKNLVHQAIHEVVVADYRDQIKNISPEDHPLQTQFSIIASFLGKAKYDAKTIFQLPSELTTIRFLGLPTNNKKKAELMIPFQLEEDVPFLAHQFHYASGLFKKGNQIQALASIVDKTKFENFHDKISQQQILPFYLTDEVSIVQSYVQTANLEKNYMIVDLGHKTTKAYLVKDKRIVSTHRSAVGGQIIDAVISETYGITLKEAVTFKHQNAFVLIPGQDKNIDQDQLEFSKMMDKILEELMNDLKRWLIGFKVAHKEVVEKIYICGGTSNLKNIKAYLSFHTSLPVKNFLPYELLNFGRIELTKSQQKCFAIGHMMGQSIGQKTPPLNFLSGAYAASHFEDLPLHSAAFAGVRVALMSMLLMLAFAIERYQLNKFDLSLDLKLNKVLKDPLLGFTVLNLRTMKLKPETGLVKIDSKIKELQLEIKSIEESSSVNALAPLAQLSQLNLISKLHLASFESMDKTASALFKPLNAQENVSLEEWDQLEKSLQDMNLLESKIEKSAQSLEIKFRYM
jgi:general secretion pathway protein L